MSLRGDRLHSLTRRDILSFGVSFIDLLEDREWEVSNRAWSVEPYQAVNPWVIEKYPVGSARKMVVTKSTQSGLSTNMMVRKFHFASNWPVRIGYTLPREQDVLDFVSTRIEPMIKASPYLKSKIGEPDNIRIKKFGDSFIYYMEMTVEPRMLPLDAIFVDEVDLSNPDNISTLLNRLDASRWKLVYYISTPTLPNFGVHAIYNTSDMRQWLVKCPRCNYEQPVDWEVNLRIVGPQNKPTRVFYGCAKCNEELTLEHIQTGRWVAEHPDRSIDMVGFHVHQMLTTHAPELYKIYRDPQTKLVEFYRKRLGKPYEIGGGSLERDDILASCFDLDYDFEPGYDGRSTYYMGVDQGNELQVLIAKEEPGSKRPKIVHVELVPMEKGFARIGQLMEIFKIRRAVGDGNPNRHGMLGLVESFLGRFLVADYIEQQKEFYIAKKGMKKYPSTITNVTINRTTGFDNLMESIKDGEWALPGAPPSLHPDVELIIDHLTAIKRDIETRRTAAGESQVAVWKKLRAEHLAHAWLYMLVARNITHGRRGRIAIIGDIKEVEPEPETDGLRPEEIKDIISYLAEVPISQVIAYFKDDIEVDSLPFPLSHKFKLALEIYEQEQIEKVMMLIIADHAKSKK